MFTIPHRVYPGFITLLQENKNAAHIEDEEQSFIDLRTVSSQVEEHKWEQLCSIPLEQMMSTVDENPKIVPTNVQECTMIKIEEKKMCVKRNDT